MSVETLLKNAAASSASDIHLIAGEPPIFRIHGDIERQKSDILKDADIYSMLAAIMNDDQIEMFNKEHELDFAIDVSSVARFRVNAFKNTRGFGAVFRVVPSEIISFEALGLPEQLKKIADLKQGIVLVTGPTGSGKSTTLAAIIDLLNQTKRNHIITIEDPIEFVHKTKHSLMHHREVGTHAESFASALRAALREDPDIVMVGEMRDLETISLALTAAETGVLVFGTLHTSSAAKTANRIIDVFPANQQDQIRSMFADSVQAIVSQTLLKRIDKPGRVAAMEILFANTAIRNMIRENQIHQINSALQTGAEDGMQSLDKHLKALLADGIISLEQVKHYISDIHELENIVTHKPNV